MRFLLPLSLLLALLGTGCSTPQKKAEKQAREQEAQVQTESSRLVEERRQRLLDGRQVSSKRGAEIAVYDPNKTFDPSRSAVGGRTYNVGKAKTKDFQYAQKATANSFRTRGFYGSKTAWAGDMKFATKNAASKDFATKEAPTKSAYTKQARDADKTAASRELADGKREYLGPESKKLRTPVDPATMGDWRNTKETVTDTGGSVEKYSTMKTLTIDDIRELLNKNK